MPAIVIPAPISSNHAAPVSAGGTGATTAAAARTNLSVYSKAETDSAISQSTAKGFFETYLSNLTSFSFTARNGANEGYLMMGCSGTVAPFVYYIGNGSGTAMTVQRIVDPYGLTVTATKSGSTITVTFNVAVTTFIKVIG